MTTAEEIPKKTNKKSQISIAYKTDASRKSLNHKEKIVNVIKKSTLKNPHDYKARKSTKSRNSISKTDSKKKVAPYQIQSQRNRSNTTMSSISRTVPFKNSKQQIVQFPFDAIKFKKQANEEKLNQNKTHDQFYIRYDEPELGQMDMKLMENSKKITGSHNQRVGRYSEQKSRNKEYISGVKSIEFRQNVLRLFKFLDPMDNRVISHSQIDYRKVPQAVLYFLGGLFQRIRQKHLYLTQKEFQQECDQAYLKSSNNDVNWFIEQVKNLGEITEQRLQKFNDKIIIKNTQTDNAHKNDELKLEGKYYVPTPNCYKSSLNFDNLSFDQQNSVISFRKESKESPLILQGRQSKASYHPSEKGSQKSAQFYQPNQHHRFSFNVNERISFGFDVDKDRSSITIKPDSIIEETISLAELEQMEFKSQAVKTGIKKNNVQKVEDMREQIYAKLDKLKIGSDVKDNNILRENFKVINSGRGTVNLQQTKDISKQNVRPGITKDLPKQNVRLGITKNYRYTDSFNLQSKNIQHKHPEAMIQKQPLMPKKQSNQIVQQKDSQSSALKEDNKKYQYQTKESGWVSNVQNCDKAFNQLQKMRDHFNQHKNTIQFREAQRQNYFKEKSNQKPDSKNYAQHQDSFADKQTRIVRLSKNRPHHQNLSTKTNKQNPSYQRNIDRLFNLSNSRDRNSLSINLNETLSNSCRKPVEITLPLKAEIGKGMSYSDKKPIASSKIDKIDELSSKLQQYLMKNAEKIEFSKNFTEKTSSNHKFNRLLAL